MMKHIPYQPKHFRPDFDQSTLENLRRTVAEQAERIRELDSECLAIFALTESNQRRIDAITPCVCGQGADPLKTALSFHEEL